MPAHHYSALPAHESAGGDDALDADDDKDDPEPLLDFQQFEIEERVEPQPIFPSTRFWSMVLFFLANTICYLDRTNISIGVIAMACRVRVVRQPAGACAVIILLGVGASRCGYELPLTLDTISDTF